MWYGNAWQRSNKKASCVFFALEGIRESNLQVTSACEKITVDETHFFRYGRWEFVVALHAIVMSGFAQ